MPELPEVETLRLGLIKYVLGHKILDVEILHPKVFQGEKEKVIGSTVKDARRVGKGLILELSNGYCLAIHIKLTGQLIYRDEKTKNVSLSAKVGGDLPNKFTHVIFKLSKLTANSQKPTAYLYYNDQRRFGWIKVIKSDKVSKLPFFRDMGPEPFKDLTFARFKFVVGKKVTKIKPLLMDQTNMGGIGNIYANDALFRAGIDPRKTGKSLSEEELKKLYDSILFVLKKGLASRGASELSFVNILGQEGEYQNHTLVYGKRGQKCPNCGSTIKFIRIGGRGTYFCPNCQQ
ncbi:MAG: DNA-formamidopyrimidine glycosylase [Candidatus Levybacteria bacterium RIFCSPHIGHO2_02_FULL_40_18]|nr:MAG: DNA-formamidopyrimidine glycosylase [Candidatus Levybacteria bacterium RIFCSPHIGHO2_01_FULL_40_58]OGH26116.1 MAG: DNA-formamidopyrimidine glycosylase [Candidatus Levybacteria bacterium RIFCSPHIGHO2_02_FULL_40_18]OGH32097.1 MAG: DNA-formamidopyrimidine glycosylase [Candidatus Levybacteria bacterium RIFCSPHIGHO2_12_FULL_40_31]OGH39937.1 MAG: DNA-formamidopyrimidine glycosylase [Candidatus Levybacteria bacterium RIFCSPLOWO2_01_FULL_40_64]OGH49591.1 MAG: DNA-formamidopyrimidine glycosylase 